MFIKSLYIVWPVVVTIMALLYRKKQNGTNPLTGGPISIPKSFWLAYTVSTWFFFPFVFVLNPEVLPGIKYVLLFHLISWWIRGPLELVMIYKWFNWSPRYGIGHDLFHLTGLLATFCYFHINESQTASNFIATAFIFITIFATTSEIYFAWLFLRFRSKAEEAENIYFASDDPKWIFINRVTLGVVCVVMAHLIWQSIFSISLF